MNDKQLQETFREAVPTHFLFRIESFSLLSKNSIEKYESTEFETHGYKWKLAIYPDGNKNENGNDHISLYLIPVDTTSLPVCWELNVSFRLFLFDQIRDRYLIRGDMDGKTSRFHEMRKVRGFPQFVSLAKFKDPSNGYLVYDTCVFGAEVFVYKPIGNIECLSMVKQSTMVTHTWKIENFSKIKDEMLFSQNFKAGDHNWNVKMYPKGSSAGKNNSVSLYLNLVDIKEKPGLKVCADFKLRIKDQVFTGMLQSHVEFCRDQHWFHASSTRWGCSKFIDVIVLESFRKAMPTHFIFKIQSFSLLGKNSLEKYESNTFEAAGFKWKWSLYPSGNKNENGKDHISLYLVMVDSTSLASGWELKVAFSLFLFDHIRDRYLIRGDTEGRTTRFHEMKKVRGFPKFVSLAKFNDPSNGYLVDDTCVFGAEVFVYKSTGSGECLSMVKNATVVTHTWKIDTFSKMKEESLYPEKFKAGDYNWNIHMYPKGNSVGKNNSVSLYLKLADIKEKPGLKVYADFKLRIKYQIIYGKHVECGDKHWFHASEVQSGWPKFISLSEMNDNGKAYLVNDRCTVEAEVKVLGKVTKLPQ